jgi:hypothetical protein
LAASAKKHGKAELFGDNMEKSRSFQRGGYPVGRE